MNEPVMVIQTALLTRDYNYRVVLCLNSLSTKYHSYLLKLSYICGQFLTVNNRHYGCCYVKKILLCTFLEFCTHSESNSARSFQNAFYKGSMALSIMF